MVDSLLASRLGSAGAVLIQGPKACGKTRTAERAAHPVGAPAVLGVVTANGYGLTRLDGVVTIPIGSLGP